MTNFSQFLTDTIRYLMSLTVEQLTLISIFVTLLIFSIDKRKEVHMKKHDAKKENYLKFIELHKDVFKSIKKDIIINKDIFHDDMFRLGSSLLSYGSNKVYKKYLFYREITNNFLIQKSRYYSAELSLYLLGNILVQIRKELSLEKYNYIDESDALGFFVNNIANSPVSKLKFDKAKFQVKMLHLEIFLMNRINFVLIKKLYYLLIAPVLGFLDLFLKYMIMIPIGQIVLKIYPKSRNWIKK